MSGCKFIVGSRQLNEKELKEYQQSLIVDNKFSPVQLSDAMKSDYYDILVDSEQEAINKLAPKDISTIEVFDDVKLFHYREEYNPNWSRLNGNVDNAKQALIKDREVVDNTPTESQLNTKLKSFLNTQGFEAKVITEFERSQEVNGKIFTVNGFVDMQKVKEIIGLNLRV